MCMVCLFYVYGDNLREISACTEVPPSLADYLGRLRAEMYLGTRLYAEFAWILSGGILSPLNDCNLLEKGRFLQTFGSPSSTC
jgi:hypothetical protein